jgi:hypothetical protein
MRNHLIKMYNPRTSHNNLLGVVVELFRTKQLLCLTTTHTNSEKRNNFNSQACVKYSPKPMSRFVLVFKQMMQAQGVIRSAFDFSSHSTTMNDEPYELLG